MRLIRLTIIPILAAALATPGAAADAASDAAAMRIAHNELAAVAHLKTEIFVAEVQFQSGGYRDEDGNNVGEYGYLNELSGRCGTTGIAAGNLELLQGPLATSDVADGYRFAVFLADGAGGAVDHAHDTSAIAKAGAHERERTFIAYAWPMSAEDGATAFAIAQDGVMRGERWNSRPPSWNDAFAARARFGGELAWPVFKNTLAMASMYNEQHAGELDRKYLRQIAEIASRTYAIGGVWSIDCATIQRLTAQDFATDVNGRPLSPTLPAFVYIRPRDPIDTKRPIFVSDPNHTHAHVAIVVFIQLPSNYPVDQPRVGMAQLEGDAATRVWATAQAVAAAPDTRLDGAAARAWAPVRDVLDAISPDAVAWEP